MYKSIKEIYEEIRAEHSVFDVRQLKLVLSTSVLNKLIGYHVGGMGVALGSLSASEYVSMGSELVKCVDIEVPVLHVSQVVG